MATSGPLDDGRHDTRGSECDDGAVDLPSGDRVTFLFSDIEGSTRLARELGPERWATTLRDHDVLVDRLVSGAGGVVVKHEGDGTFAAFVDPAAAARAAVALSRALVVGSIAGERPMRVRIGLHTGLGSLTEDGTDYVGIDVNYAARVTASANGGQIVLSDAAAPWVAANLPDGSTIVDEGFHPLRDFEEPRHLHRLVVPDAADDARPLRSLHGPTNLPESVTALVGRDRELRDIADLLERSRILTLTGPGGTGKTRLAIGVAGAVRRRFPDGTWFVELAPLRDPALIASAIATAIGVRELPDTPVIDTLRTHLRDRNLLIILDNLEQLLPAAAGIVADLARQAPAVRFVITSREVLRVAGEQEFAVPPLTSTAASELFVQRAQLVRPEFRLDATTRPDVEAIVARLDGMPLAIELAAARIRMFGPARILERLERSLDLLGGGARDLPERQRTLRGAIGWSVDLLNQTEQLLFQRLAVFDGGWTIEAAQSVADPEGLEIDALVGLESLADKSLVRIQPTDHGEPRFEGHAFIREFAAERLEAADERPLCERRHAAVYLAFAESAGPHLMAADSDAWIDLIDHEEHNLRSAMRWSLTTGAPDVGLRIAAAMWRFWHQKPKLREGRGWLAELLAHPAGQEVSAVRVRALSAAGGLAYWANDFPAAWVAYETALAMAERLGEARLIADGHYELGFRYVVEPDLERLRAHETAAGELYQALGDDEAVLRTRQALVLGSFLGGEFDAARRLETENLAAFRTTGSWYRTADSLTLLSAIELLGGDAAAAAAHIREALSIVGPRALAAPVVGALGVAALVALARDAPETAARLAGATDALAARAEITNAMIEVLHMPDPVVAVRGRLGPAAEPLLEEGRLLSLDAAVALAFVDPVGTPAAG
jgi:predicted ATPase/class 3 adenylate cyclase